MGKRVLLVEGKDDRHVVRQLCWAHSIRDDVFEIRSSDSEADYQGDDGGIERLIESISVWLKASDLEALAILVDADENTKARWASLCGRFAKEGHNVLPPSPQRGGLVVPVALRSTTIRLGLWVMPDNELPGSVEDFLALLVPEGDKIMPRVMQFVDGIPKADRLFAPRHTSKARIHAFLAVQRNPGKPLGLAIRFKYLDAGSPVASQFVDWIRRALL